MTLINITERIAEIEKAKCDDEKAHRLEDQLREDFISYIASLGPNQPLSSKAKLILSTKDIPFGRWVS